MRDFDKQLKRYGDELRSSRCPYNDAELDRAIRSVVWSEQHIPTKPQPRGPHRRWLWPTVTAAACLAAILIPLNIHDQTDNSIASVNVDGKHLYYACNNGCSPEGTLQTFKTLIR